MSTNTNVNTNTFNAEALEAMGVFFDSHGRGYVNLGWNGADHPRAVAFGPEGVSAELTDAEMASVIGPIPEGKTHWAAARALGRVAEDRDENGDQLGPDYLV